MHIQNYDDEGKKSYPPAFKSVERYILGIGNVERIREIVRVEVEMVRAGAGAGLQVVELHGMMSGERWQRPTTLGQVRKINRMGMQREQGIYITNKNSKQM